MKKTHAFNVMLTPEDNARLGELALTTGFSKGQVLRMGLENSWMMKCRNIPVCANGEQCRVPAMHAPEHALTPAPAVTPALSPEAG